MSGWYKVEFHGKPAEGQAPKLPATGEEMLKLAAPLFALFGFEVIDTVTITKAEASSLAMPACGPCSLGVHDDCHRRFGNACACPATDQCGAALRVFVAEAP